MFAEVYGLAEDPFNRFVSRQIYLGVSHRKAFAALSYGIERGGRIQLLLADSGLGKTALLSYLHGRARNYANAILLAADESKDLALLNCLASEPRANQSDGNLKTRRAVDQTGQSKPGRERLILLVDDAQELSDAELESVLALTKLEAFQRQQASIVLAGRPELTEKLKHAKFPEICEQIGIEPLGDSETEGYISHRLRLAAGGRPPVFTQEACAIIAKRSGGIPQKINDICLMALISGAKHGLKLIDARMVNAVDPDRRDQVTLPRSRASAPSSRAASFWNNRSLKAPLMLTASLVVVAAGLWYESEASRRVRDSDRPTESVDLAGISAGTAVQATPAQQSAKDRSATIGTPTIKTNGMGGGGEISKPPSPKTDGNNQTILVSPVTHQEAPRAAAQDHISVNYTPAAGGAAAATTLTAVPRSTPLQMLTPPVFHNSPSRDARRVPPPLRSAAAMTAEDSHRARVDTDVGDDFMRLRQYDNAIYFYKAALARSPGNQQLQQRISEARRARAAAQ